MCSTRVNPRPTFIQYLYLGYAFETPDNFAGYVDDNTPYTYSSKIEHVLTNLQDVVLSFRGFLQITW